MRRFMPSARRLTTLTGATVAGAVATVLLAAPAMACSADVKAKDNPVCDTTTGTFSLTWQLRNDSDDITATLDQATFQVKLKNSTSWTTGTGALSTDTVSSTKYVDIATQTGIPAGAKAKMTVHVVWHWNSDGYGHKKGDKAGEKTVGSDETLCGSCEKTPGNGGGGGGTTPTPTATAPASPVPSRTATAAPTLPVTGSSTGLYAGGAVVLLGAGTGLFVLARRRRVKFEA